MISPYVLIGRLVVAGGAACAPLGAVAEPVNKRPSAITFAPYGVLNGAVFGVDDGLASRSFGANNENTTSRLGFRVTQPNDDMTLQFHFETALGLPNSKAHSNNPAIPDPTFDWDRDDLRKVELILSSRSWGKLFVGQGSTASDHTSEIDLSGATNAIRNKIPVLAGGYQFRIASSGALSNVQLGEAFNQFDGNGRKGRVRYDTPSYAGFVLSASYGKEILRSTNDRQFWDLAVRYKAEFDGMTIDSKVAYFVKDRSGVQAEFFAGSASVLLDWGLNFTVAAGTRRSGGDYVYGKIGVRRDLVAWGETAVAVDYYAGSDMVLATGATWATSESWGIGLAQNIDRHDLQIYAGYRKHAYDDDVATYRDVDAFLGGLIWRF